MDSLKGELSTIKKLSQLDDPQSHEDYREPLEVSQTVEVKILLSWGGPEDGFKLQFTGASGEKELIGGIYYMADWGEYEEVQLSDSQAQSVCDFYLGGELPE